MCHYSERVSRDYLQGWTCPSPVRIFQFCIRYNILWSLFVEKYDRRCLHTWVIYNQLSISWQFLKVTRTLKFLNDPSNGFLINIECIENSLCPRFLWVLFSGNLDVRGVIKIFTYTPGRRGSKQGRHFLPLVKPSQVCTITRGCDDSLYYLRKKKSYSYLETNLLFPRTFYTIWKVYRMFQRNSKTFSPVWRKQKHTSSNWVRRFGLPT